MKGWDKDGKKRRELKEEYGDGKNRSGGEVKERNRT